MDGFNVLGCHDRVGDVLSTLLQAGASVAEGAIEEHQTGDVASKKSATAHAQLEDAEAKDTQAAVAVAHAIVSAALKAKTADSNGRFAEKALADARAAGARLSPEDEHLRDDAARAQLDQARARAVASPKDGYKAALAKAWEKVVGDQGAPASDKKKSSEPWLTRRVLGPLPGYGVVVGGGGLLAGVGFAIKHFLRR